MIAKFGYQYQNKAYEHVLLQISKPSYLYGHSMFSKKPHRNIDCILYSVDGQYFDLNSKLFNERKSE